MQLYYRKYSAPYIPNMNFYVIVLSDETTPLFIVSPKRINFAIIFSDIFVFFENLLNAIFDLMSKKSNE